MSEQAEVVLCSWCGATCGEDAWDWDRGNPYCGEPCYEAAIRDMEEQDQ